MLETEWLATDHVSAMLAHLQTGSRHRHPDGPTERFYAVSARKLRLFACAVCRQAWDGAVCPDCLGAMPTASECPNPECDGGRVGGLTDPRSRHAVETVERHADGLATDDELAAACRFAGGVAGPSDDASWWAYVWAAGGHVGQASGRIECVPAAVQAALLRDVVGNPFRPTPRCQSCLGGGYVPTDRDDNTCDVCGGKGRHVPRRWLTPAVRALARACYDERDGEACGRCAGTGTQTCPKCSGEGCSVYGIAANGPCTAGDPCPDCGGTGRVVTTGHLDPVRLRVLADALEEAGATDAQLISHLRSQGTHVRGCWVVDIIIGKS
jgi:hypothetical protein